MTVGKNSIIIINNKKKLLKKALCLLFAFLFSINSFAAIVSDNDGSAFVTKAEFEELKNNFSAQINNYNNSIDNKIDGAVAYYLAGITKKNEHLDNLYEVCGGEKIRFGKPNINPRQEPITGWAMYFVNCYTNGFVRLSRGAGFVGIKNGGASEWSSSGQGQMGRFIEYSQDSSGNRYMLVSHREMCQAVYEGGWYSNTNYKYVTQEYPYGSEPPFYKQPVAVGAYSGVDCYLSEYRPDGVYNQWDDLNWYTSSWDVNTANDVYFVSEDNYKKLTKYRTISDQSDSTGGGTDLYSVTFSNIRIYGWDWIMGKYTDYCPGFFNGTGYAVKCFGGVPFFNAERAGNVTIENIEFARSDTTAASPIYFAISDTPFTNSSTIKGNVKFDKVTNATLDDASNNLYVANTGAKVKIEFPVEKGKTYYIKMQYQKSSVVSDAVYSIMKNGATITFVED